MSHSSQKNLILIEQFEQFMCPSVFFMFRRFC